MKPVVLSTSIYHSSLLKTSLQWQEFEEWENHISPKGEDKEGDGNKILEGGKLTDKWQLNKQRKLKPMVAVGQSPVILTTEAQNPSEKRSADEAS